MMLNPQSPKPLYRQLADLVLAEIRAGNHPPGSRIPSEHALAGIYRIGRPTVRQATEFLVRKGVLVRKRGSGTYVQTPREAVDLFSFAGTIHSFREKGIPVETRIIAKTRLKPVGNDPENPFAGSKAFYFARLSRVEEVPVLLEDIYLDPVLFAGIDRMDLEGRSLSQMVEEIFYLHPTGGDQNFRIVYTRGKKAENLSITEKTPVLLVKRFLHFPQAQNAVYSELYCRTDRFVFSQTLGGPPNVESGVL